MTRRLPSILSKRCHPNVLSYLTDALRIQTQGPDGQRFDYGAEARMVKEADEGRAVAATRLGRV